MPSGCLQDDFRMNQRALSKNSESTQKALLKSNPRERDQSDFVILSEPKIIPLVHVNLAFSVFWE